MYTFLREILKMQPNIVLYILDLIMLGLSQQPVFKLGEIKMSEHTCVKVGIIYLRHTLLFKTLDRNLPFQVFTTAASKIFCVI